MKIDIAEAEQKTDVLLGKAYKQSIEKMRSDL
jgi:hypothetical protein